MKRFKLVDAPHAYTATITGRGQVTLPAEIRRALGVTTKDRVTFTLSGKRKVVVTPATFTLESAFGSVGPATSTDDLLSIIEQAKDKRAEEIVRKMKGHEVPRHQRHHSLPG